MRVGHLGMMSDGRIEGSVEWLISMARSPVMASLMASVMASVMALMHGGEMPRPRVTSRGRGCAMY